jgi:hypothetical protein
MLWQIVQNVERRRPYQRGRASDAGLELREIIKTGRLVGAVCRGLLVGLFFPGVAATQHTQYCPAEVNLPDGKQCYESHQGK